MIPKTLEQVTMDDLQALVDGQISESKTLEYKRELPAPGDVGTGSFLKAVSALANTDGGDLIYGIAATDGIPTALPGIEGEPDPLRLRLENCCRTTLDPPLKIDMKFILVAEGRRILIVRVPKSWAGPHGVISIGSRLRQFYARHSAGTFPLDTGELRDAFLMSKNVIERIKEFRFGRLSQIHSYNTPIPLLVGCKLVLHLIPLSSFAGNTHIRIPTHHERLRAFHPMGRNQWFCRDKESISQSKL